jgi:hypothetical protein
MKTSIDQIWNAVSRAVEVAAAMLFLGLMYFVVTAS